MKCGYVVVSKKITANEEEINFFGPRWTVAMYNNKAQAYVANTVYKSLSQAKNGLQTHKDHATFEMKSKKVKYDLTIMEVATC